MEQNFNAEERELIKLVNFFKKNNERLNPGDAMAEEYKVMMETCDRLMEQLNIHAKNRQIILGEREQLRNLIKDNAHCPKCEKNANLKLSGTDKSVQGWLSNKYRCRKCNIEFVWNAPNNPWDMVAYVEHFVHVLEEKMKEESVNEESRKANEEALSQMRSNLGKIKPVVDASELDLKDLQEREIAMADMVNKVKKHLLIEKIRLDL